MTKRKAKTYEAEHKGRKVRVTVPPNDKAEDALATKQDYRDPVEPSVALQDVLQDCMSPEAVAVIAANLHGIVNTKNDGVNREVAWFTDQLLEMLGDQYNALCEEIGL